MLSQILPEFSFSITTFILIAIQGLTLYWVIWTIYTRTLHPLSKVPGPLIASITRLWLVRNTLRGDMEKVQRAMHQKYGPLIRVAPNEVVCADPDAVKRIYRIQDPLVKTDFYPVWASGRNVFSKHLDLFAETSNKKHGERRRIVNHVYTLGNILKFEEFIDECSEIFIEKMGELADVGEPIDLGQWLQWYTFDVIGQLFFGRMFGFMAEAKDHEGWIQALDSLVPYIVATATSPSYARSLISMSAIFNKAAREGVKSMARIVDAARDCVAQRQASPVFGKDGSPRRDLLQQMLDLMHEKGEKVDFSIGDIQVEAHVALFAGSETTAGVMRGVVYHLMKHPTVYDEVQSGIDSAFRSGHFSSNIIRYSEAIQLPWLCATIKEAMRLHPSVGLSMPRLSPREGIELANTFIPRGYRAGVNAAVVQYDKSIYGFDADEFRPSRWLNNDNKIVAEMEKYMLQFGTGTRTCIGKHIALCEVHKLIPHLLRDFELSLVDQHAEWETKNMFIFKQTGIRAWIRRRYGIGPT